MIDGSNIGKARVLQNKGQMVFHEHEFTCVDCGKHINNPEFRIKTNNGWKWICKGCQNKITYKKGA